MNIDARGPRTRIDNTCDCRDRTAKLILTAECPEEMIVLAALARQFFEMPEGRMRLDMPIQWTTAEVPAELTNRRPRIESDSDTPYTRSLRRASEIAREMREKCIG
jgi:hypothetical protein